MKLNIDKENDVLEITLHADLRYNSDMIIDQSIILATKLYWKSQGETLHDRFKKSIKKQERPLDVTDAVIRAQFKNLKKIKKALDFFETIDPNKVQFNENETSKTYNKHIKTLFEIRRTMWT